MANKNNIDGASDAAHSSLNKGAWTADEDRTLAQYVAKHGPKRWKSVAIQSGLNRCGKSCRLRWLNYLRPDVKRGNMSDAEDDLILRLHRLLGNRWSLIAKRLPGRTDNEIKNYWNAHLRKKAKLMERLPAFSTAVAQENGNEGSSGEAETRETKANSSRDGDSQLSCDGDDEPFDLSTRLTDGLEWVKSFLELEEDC